MNEYMVLGGFFLFVMAAVSAAGYFLMRRESEPAAGVPLMLQGPEATGVKRFAFELFHMLGDIIPASEASREAERRRLGWAGYRHPSALPIFYGVKCASGLLLAVILALVTLSTRGDPSSAFAASVCGLGFGFLLPDRLLSRRIAARNLRLRRALPPALDLIVMGLEAGQPLDQTMISASRGLRNLFPELSEELAQVHRETRASKSRAEAVRRLAERNADGDLTRFCQLLLDSDRFGTSLGPALRAHARYLRIRFRQRAQEAARKLTVKMVFPVFFLIFPAVLLVTLGPAVMLMRKHFGALLGN